MVISCLPCSCMGFVFGQVGKPSHVARSQGNRKDSLQECLGNLEEKRQRKRSSGYAGKARRAVDEVKKLGRSKSFVEGEIESVLAQGARSRGSLIITRSQLRDSSKPIEDFYEMVAFLGEGNFGTVHKFRRRAQQSQNLEEASLNDVPEALPVPLDRYVAVKQLKWGRIWKNCWRDADSEDLMKAELMVLIMLDHPNIVDFYEWYEDPRRGIFFVMEYVEGKSLQDELDGICQDGVEESRWANLPRLTEYFHQIVYAVSYLHGLEPAVVHRDLKPDNILIVKDGTDYDTHCVKLIDFGLVEKGGQKYTASDLQRHGTLLFMSPEYLLFHEGEMGPDMDMWALGIIFSWMMTALALGSLQHPLLPEEDGTRFEVTPNNLLMALRDRATWRLELKVGMEKDAIEIADMLLVYNDEGTRATASELLETKWLHRNKRRSTSGVLDYMRSLVRWDGVVDNLRVYHQLSKFDQLLLVQGVRSENSAKLKKLRQAFQALDKSQSGRLTKLDVIDGIKQSGAVIKMCEIDEIFDSLAEESPDGQVDWMHWIAATVGFNILRKDEAVQEAFELFDFDNTGYITREALVRVVGESEVDKLFNSDTGYFGSEHIDLESFRAMARKLVEQRARVMFSRNDLGVSPQAVASLLERTNKFGPLAPGESPSNRRARSNSDWTTPTTQQLDRPHRTISSLEAVPEDQEYHQSSAISHVVTRGQDSSRTRSQTG